MTSIVLVVWALLAVITLIGLRLLRERRLRRHTRLRLKLMAGLRTLITGSGNGDAERELTGHGFIAVALDLLLQVDGPTRERLIDLMRRYGADTRLRRGLRGLSQSKRVAAAEALRFFPTPDNQWALNRALADKDADVRIAAAASLIAQDAAPALDVLLPLLTRKRTMPVRLGQILQDYCDRDSNAVAAVAHNTAFHPFVRAKAVETLAATGDPRHVSTIQSLVLSPEPDLRAAALRAFGKLPNTISSDAVAMCLRDESWFVRAAAADTAGALGFYHLVPLLAPLVDDDEWWVRFRASEALEALDGAGRAALREMAKLGSSRQRRQAALTLSKTGAA